MQHSKDQTIFIRHCMLYEFKLGRSATQTRENLVQVFGAQAPCVQAISYWFRCFKGGNFDVSDLPRSGGPVLIEFQGIFFYLFRKAFNLLLFLLSKAASVNPHHSERFFRINRVAHTSVNQHPGRDTRQLLCDGLTIQLINMRSTKSNMELFISTLLRENIDLIIFTETKNYTIEQNMLGIPSYEGLHKSNDNCRAGGVSISVRQDIPASTAGNLQCEACNAITVELIRGQLRLAVTAIYRSPTPSVSDPHNFIENDLARITSFMSAGVDCLIVDDINICVGDRGQRAVEYLD